MQMPAESDPVWQRNYVTRIPIYPHHGVTVQQYTQQPRRLIHHPESFANVMRTRFADNRYEFSDDIRSKQLDMLEKKYGGRRRANRAAAIIQRAYRRYKMNETWKCRIRATQNTHGTIGHHQGSRAPVYHSSRQNHKLSIGSKQLRQHFTSVNSLSATADGGVLQRAQHYAPLTTQLRIAPSPNQSAITRIPVRPDQTSTMPNAKLRSISTERANQRKVFTTAPSIPRILSQESDVLGQSLPSVSSPSSDSSRHLSESVDSSSHNSDVWQHQAARRNQSLNVNIGTQTQSKRVLTEKENAERKLKFRVALNWFNKKPERGIQLMIDFGYLEASPAAVAHFLLHRTGLSKAMIAEYLGTAYTVTQNEYLHFFHKDVLDCFVKQFSFAGVEVDVALRKFQETFTLRGEAQKIERIIEAFANRYYECNSTTNGDLLVAQCSNADHVFLIAYAIIMLNTDLHNPSLKEKSRMKLADFVNNLRGALKQCNLNESLLAGIYQRIKTAPFLPGKDHISMLNEIDRSIIGAKKPALALAHRRLKCYCRLHEIADVNKRQSEDAHSRDIFLFNDLVLVAKCTSKTKQNREGRVTDYSYHFRQAHALLNVQVTPFKNQHYDNGIEISFTLDNRKLFFNARAPDDRVSFIKDLLDAVKECEHMEQTRVELEMAQNSLLRGLRKHQADESNQTDDASGASPQRDSGISDEPTGSRYRALSSSMLDTIGDESSSSAPAPANQAQARARPSSVNSCDSGMSSTASVESGVPTTKPRSNSERDTQSTSRQ